MMTLKEIVKDVEREMRCNCDLDKWEPERDTGHSWVCRIHKVAKLRLAKQAVLHSANRITGGELPGEQDDCKEVE